MERRTDAHQPRWVELEVTGLSGQDLAIARLALVLAKAPYQVDERLIEDVLSEDRSEERFIRLLAWASFSGARKFAQRIAEAACGQVAGLRML
ncbi:MAG TPA: hypothetical protein VLR92_03410, partial [Blastocatellia bacterium]|nr:hypothetical protein [Blastocatellia bacterium]